MHEPTASSTSKPSSSPALLPAVPSLRYEWWQQSGFFKADLNSGAWVSLGHWRRGVLAGAAPTVPMCCCARK